MTVINSELIMAIKGANYSDLDVSDYAKELMMCCVVQQSEMELCAPQLTVQSLQVNNFSN